MEINQSNTLLELCSQIFALSSYFYSDDKGKSLDDTITNVILTEFDRFQQQAVEAKIDVNTIQYAKYALAAYMDEVILNSSWTGRQGWMARSLQFTYFGEHSAGEGFFTRLSQLRQGGINNTDVLEVYYFCLQLGFEGIYRMQGLEKLLALQVDLYSQIDRARGSSDSRLASDVLPEKNIVTKVGREVPFWVIGSVTLSIMFFIYLGFSLMINHQADEALTQINTGLQALKPPFKQSPDQLTINAVTQKTRK